MENTHQFEKVTGAPEVSHLDGDTQRAVKSVYRNGYYELHQGLGVGGWPVVYSFAQNWRTYVLTAKSNDQDFEDTIVAKDDESARKAFAGKYALDACEFHQIAEKTITYREI